MNIGIDIDDTLVETNKKALEIKKGITSASFINWMFDDIIDKPEEVKEIVNEAIRRSGQKKLFNKARKDEDGYTILKEKDFE